MMASIEKENGSIKLTAKEYKKTKNAIIEDYNYWIDRCLHVAQKCYEHLEENIDEYKSKSKSLFVRDYLSFNSNGDLVRNKISLNPNNSGDLKSQKQELTDVSEKEKEQSNNFIKTLVNEIVKHAMYYENSSGSLIARGYQVDISEQGASFVKKGLIHEDSQGLLSIHKPNERHFPTLKDKSEKIDFEFGSLHFDDKEKRITWNVEPAEFAIKQAWNTKTGISFNNALSNVEDWKESTGGIFYSTVNNDEPKISRYLGPIGQQEYKSRLAKMRSSIKPR